MIKVAIISTDEKHSSFINSFFKFYASNKGFHYDHYSGLTINNAYPKDEHLGLYKSYSQFDIGTYKPELNASQYDAIIYASKHDYTCFNHVFEGDDQVISSSSKLSLHYVGSKKYSVPKWLNLAAINVFDARSHDSKVQINLIEHALDHQGDNKLIQINNEAVCLFFERYFSHNTIILYISADRPSIGLGFDTVSIDDYYNKLAQDLSYFENSFIENDNSLILLNDPRVKTEGNQSYGFFAKQYDEYMSHVDYNLWVNSIIKWSKKHGNVTTRILELACGTANVSSLLCLRGYEVDACDKSIHMLLMADKKATKPHLFARTLTEQLPQKDYNLVLCLFDSVNYLLNKSELVQMLDCVYSSLDESGLFIFDISTILNSLENFADTFNMTIKSNYYMFHHAEYDENSEKQRSHLYQFVNTPTGYILNKEKHTQKVYRHIELIDLIAQSKFQLVGLYSTENQNNLLSKINTPLDEKYMRLFYVLKKF